MGPGWRSTWSGPEERWPGCSDGIRSSPTSSASRPTSKSLQPGTGCRKTSTRADHYLLDGGSIPLTSTMVTVAYRHRQGLATETRQFWSSPIRPVVDRSDGKVVVIKAAG